MKPHGFHPFSHIFIPPRDLQMKIRAGVSPKIPPLTDHSAGVMGAVTIRGAGAGRLEPGKAVPQDLLAIHHDRD
jgi:hypothetical protein